MGWFDFFLALSVMAVVAKSVLFLISINKPWIADSWRGFVLILLMLNVCELAVITVGVDVQGLNILLDCYFGMLLLALVYGVNYVSDPDSQFQTFVVTLCLGAVFLLTVQLFLDNGLNYAFSDEGHMLWSSEDPALSFFIWFTMFMISLMLVLLIYNHRQAKLSPVVKIDLTHINLALLVGLLSSMIGLLLITPYFDVNLAMVMPISTLLFLLITLRGKRKIWLLLTKPIDQFDYTAFVSDGKKDAWIDHGQAFINNGAATMGFGRDGKRKNIIEEFLNRGRSVHDTVH